MKKAAISLLLIILFTALAISASAATIYPMQNSVSIGRLQGLELPVDISWEGGWEARVTIYSYDLYSGSDLSRIRPGDSIMIDGRLENVLTVEWDGNMLWINGNFENSWSFYDETGNGSYTCMDGYYHTASSAIGVVIIDPNVRFTCQDYLDLANDRYRDPPLVYSPNEFIEVLKKDGSHFHKHYTFALFNMDNMPQVIYRYYSAIESY